MTKESKCRFNKLLSSKENALKNTVLCFNILEMLSNVMKQHLYNEMKVFLDPIHENACICVYIMHSVYISSNLTKSNFGKYGVYFKNI